MSNFNYERRSLVRRHIYYTHIPVLNNTMCVKVANLDTDQGTILYLQALLGVDKQGADE